MLPRALLAVGLLLSLPALAQSPAGKSAGAGGIYTCTTPEGRRLSSDRPIHECADREQRVLNADGSLRRVQPPAQSPEEQAAQTARENRLAAERAAQADVARRDRNLLMRYPSEAAHRRARESALDDGNKAMRLSEKRIAELQVERKTLLDEAEFYKGKPLPPKLKQSLDANEVSTEAQRVLVDNQRAELVRINARYDGELARLKHLWAGVAPGAVPDAAAIKP